jgi:hypothetical protein
MNKKKFQQLLRSLPNAKENARRQRIGERLRKRLEHYFETRIATKKSDFDLNSSF